MRPKTTDLESQKRGEKGEKSEKRNGETLRRSIGETGVKEHKSTSHRCTRKAEEVCISIVYLVAYL